MYLELIRKIRDDMYVDDLGESLQEVEKINSDSIGLFDKGGLNFTIGTQMN